MLTSLELRLWLEKLCLYEVKPMVLVVELIGAPSLFIELTVVVVIRCEMMKFDGYEFILHHLHLGNALGALIGHKKVWTKVSYFGWLVLSSMRATTRQIDDGESVLFLRFEVNLRLVKSSWLVLDFKMIVDVEYWLKMT